MNNIRHRLNDYWFNFGEHIGYCVRKSERQARYALEICINLDLDKVLIPSDKSNKA